MILKQMVLFSLFMAFTGLGLVVFVSSESFICGLGFAFIGISILSFMRATGLLR